MSQSRYRQFIFVAFRMYRTRSLKKLKLSSKDHTLRDTKSKEQIFYLYAIFITYHSLFLNLFMFNISYLIF